MKLIVAFMLSFSNSAYAGIPTNISPEQIEDLAIEVILWRGMSSTEIARSKDHLLCTPVSVFFPLVDALHPEYTNVTASAVISLNGRPFAFPAVFVFKAENGEHNVAEVCAPINSDYKIDITYSFSPPEDADAFPLCPPSYLLSDIERYVKEPELK